MTLEPSTPVDEHMSNAMTSNIPDKKAVNAWEGGFKAER
jgi:hypothetical protein